MTEQVERNCHEVVINSSADLQATQTYEIQKWRD